MKKWFIKAATLLLLGFLFFYPGRFLVENPSVEKENDGVSTCNLPEEEEERVSY